VSRRILVIGAAVLALAGCAALKEISAPFQEDPVKSTLFVVKEQVIAIRTSIFIPRDLASPSGLCEDNECVDWRRIDRGLTLAQNNAVTALATINEPGPRRMIALALANQALDGFSQLATLDGDPGRRAIYAQAIAAVRAAITELNSDGGGA